MRCTDKNFGAKRLLVTAGKRLECPRLEDLPSFSGKTRQSISSSISFALSIIKRALAAPLAVPRQ